MKIDKFNKLKANLETFSFESNFKKLAVTLYYFSFLGNIFLVLFSYFFLKNVTDGIPQLFVGQEIFFGFFVLLFMSGYELFKRFAFEQLTLSILKTQKFTVNLFVGIVVSLALISGSFYLSLNGAHRLIDTTENIEQTVDNTVQQKSDSINRYYNVRLNNVQTQIQKIYDNDADGLLFSREKESLNRWEKTRNDLDSTRIAKIKEIEDKYQSKTVRQINKIEENDLAFVLLVFFLEFIILIGVAFDAYYVWGSYDNMKMLLGSAKFRELELNLKLLRIFYQDGRRKKDEEIIDNDKFAASCSMQNIDVDKTDLNNFLQLSFDLGLIQRRKDNNLAYYMMDYLEARQLLENQIYI